jgi:hypothetical protein
MLIEETVGSEKSLLWNEQTKCSISLSHSQDSDLLACPHSTIMALII